MDIKSVFLILDCIERAEALTTIAADLCEKHAADLTVASLLDSPFKSSKQSHDYPSKFSAFKEFFSVATASIPNINWIEPSAKISAVARDAILVDARYSDLVVAGQSIENSASNFSKELIEEIILRSGRPVLVIPYAGEFSSEFNHAVFAWKDSRASARATSDALKLLNKSVQATVLSIVENHDQKSAGEPLVRHLRSHGISATSSTLVADKVGVMDMLLSRTADIDGEILIMGAHQNTGIFTHGSGSGTEYILHHMTVPILMSR